MDIHTLDPSFYQHAVVIPTDSCAALHLQQHLLQSLRLHHFDESDVYAVRLALEEAFVNAMKHGNKCDPAKHVHVHYRLDENGFFIHIRDEGTGFRHADVPDPRRCDHLEEPNGRGLLLIKHYMDSVQYLQNGTVLVMSKQRKVRKPPSD